MSYLLSTKKDTNTSSTKSACLFYKSLQTQVTTLNDFFLGSTEKDKIKILEHSKCNAITKNYSLIFQLLKKIVDG